VRKIEIVGDAVRIVSTVVEREISLDDFKQHLFTVKAFSTPRMPSGTPFVIGFADSERVAYVMERPPGLKHLTLVAKDRGVQSDYEEENEDEEDEPRNEDGYIVEEYDVMVPWQYWMLVTDHKPAQTGRIRANWPVRGVSYFWSESQIESIDEKSVYRAYTPNTQGPTYFCTGRSEFESETLEILGHSIADTWWDIPFNTHLGRGLHSDFGSLNEWEEAGRAPGPEWNEPMYSLEDLAYQLGGQTTIKDIPLAPTYGGTGLTIDSTEGMRKFLNEVDRWSMITLEQLVKERIDALQVQADITNAEMTLNMEQARKEKEAARKAQLKLRRAQELQARDITEDSELARMTGWFNPMPARDTDE